MINLSVHLLILFIYYYTFDHHSFNHSLINPTLSSYRPFANLLLLCCIFCTSQLHVGCLLRAFFSFEWLDGFSTLTGMSSDIASLAGVRSVLLLTIIYSFFFMLCIRFPLLLKSTCARLPAFVIYFLKIISHPHHLSIWLLNIVNFLSSRIFLSVTYQNIIFYQRSF